MDFTTEQQTRVNEGKDLVESGDMSLPNFRDAYVKLFGKPTTLNDEQIILCAMSQPDDFGHADVAHRMRALEEGDTERVESEDDLSSTEQAAE